MKTPVYFNFDLTQTTARKYLKLWSFPLCKYSLFFTKLFFALWLASLLFFCLSFLGSANQFFFLKITLLFGACALIFWEVSLFISLKIENYIGKPIPKKLPGSEYEDNLAEYLSLPLHEIIEYAITISKSKKMLSVKSETLLHAVIAKNSTVRILMHRLGIDADQFQEELKNYLEKQEKRQKFELEFSDSFQQTILESLRIAKERKHMAISEKDLLAALAACDPFFKEILIKMDLQEKDILQITLWLDDLEEKLKERKKFWTIENLSRLGSLGRDFASGFTVTLDQFSANLEESAKNNIFGEIIGHAKEINELENVLIKSELKNALLVGEIGTGRRSIVEALAQKCYLRTGLAELRGKRVVELDMVSLFARITSIEELESVIDQIFKEAIFAGNIILVIDNIEDVIGKNSALASADISNILGKYLALPDFQFIAITSFDGLHKVLEQHPSLLEYFSKIEVSEISELETIRILQNTALELEKKHRIFIAYPAVREIINLTARYFPTIPFPKKAIDILQESVIYAMRMKEKSLTPHHIAVVISEKTQIPIGKIEFKERSILLNLENLIHQKIINQEESVKEISSAMRRARSGISSSKRPMGTFLFLGPTGVGKTETAKALADIYFGSQDKMIRIDMSEFQSVLDIPRLIGSTVPVLTQGLFTTPVRENPFSLILLDEIEKAHRDILNIFLQVFDEGYITDGQGRKVIFSNTIIICTSNAGSAQIFSAVESGKTIQKDDLLNSFFEKGVFKPEFINRFDATILFHPLTKDNLLDIAQLMLADLAKRLKEQGVAFSITSLLKEKIVDLSYKPQFGAREMRRVIQGTVENSIAQALLSGAILKGDSVEVNPENFQAIKIHQ